MHKIFKKDIFISHSSNNAVIAEQLGAFLKNLGISNDRIFCSSVLGQGVNNGEKLNDAIFNAINNARIIIYILSKDFLSSSYCIEELGAGWYLSSNKQTYCYYLRLPDMELSELCGFVNSKIDKFSLMNSSDDLALFVENICHTLNLKVPRLTEISSYIGSFLSAINNECRRLSDKKAEYEKLEQERINRIEQLEKDLVQKNQLIDECNINLKLERERKATEALKAELNTTSSYFRMLAYGQGIASSTIKTISKDFWFKLINRYNEILSLLKIEPFSYEMERLIAQIYITYGDCINGYAHFKYAIQNCDDYVSFYEFEGFLKEYPLSISEIIELLKEKVKSMSEGIAKDGTTECIRQLEEREIKIATSV